MTCPKCGENNGEGYRFCQKCGTALISQTYQQVQQPQQSAQGAYQQVQQPQQCTQGAYQQPRQPQQSAQGAYQQPQQNAQNYQSQNAWQHQQQNFQNYQQQYRNYNPAQGPHLGNPGLKEAVDGSYTAFILALCGLILGLFFVSWIIAWIIAIIAIVKINGRKPLDTTFFNQTEREMYESAEKRNKTSKGLVIATFIIPVVKAILAVIGYIILFTVLGFSFKNLGISYTL